MGYWVPIIAILQSKSIKALLRSPSELKHTLNVFQSLLVNPVAVTIIVVSVWLQKTLTINLIYYLYPIKKGW